MDSYDQVEFSIDILSAAEREATFLRNIEKNHFELYNENTVRNAVRRYETIWLPLQAKYNDVSLEAPMDVRWVWHTHMLSPLNYRRDCDLIVQTVINHQFADVDQSGPEVRNHSLKAWEEFAGGEPYDYRSSQPASYQQKSTYNIEEAVQRQRHFNYHVSLPHYTSRTFLTESVERYKRYLWLIRSYPGEFFTPCYDFDLVWHAHQAHPTEYASDTKGLLGRILDHNDTVDDRPHGKQLKADEGRTRDRWQENYPNSPFWRRGSMYRGHKAPAALGIVSETKAKLSEAQISISRIEAHGLIKFKSMSLNLRLDGKQAAYFDLIKKAETFEWNGFERKIPISLQKPQTLIVKPKFEKHKHSVQIATVPFNVFAHAENESTVIQLKDRKSSKPTGASINFKATMIPARQQLNLHEGQFIQSSVSMGELFELCYAAALNKPKNCKSMDAYMADHRLSNSRGETTYSIKVVHSAQHLLSMFCVYDSRNQLLAVSHLAGPDTLPSDEQIGNDYNVPHLSVANERAMVIMNRTGDHSLLKGKWLGFKRRTTGSRGRGGERGSPGYLSLRVDSLQSFTPGKFKIQDLPNLYVYGSWDFLIGGSNVGSSKGLKTGLQNLGCRKREGDLNIFAWGKKCARAGIEPGAVG